MSQKVKKCAKKLGAPYLIFFNVFINLSQKCRAIGKQRLTFWLIFSFSQKHNLLKLYNIKVGTIIALVKAMDNKLRYIILADYFTVEVTVKDIEELKQFMKKNDLEKCPVKKISENIMEGKK